MTALSITWGGRCRDLKAARRSYGFSLVELLVVMGIMMVIAAMAVPNILQAVYNVRLRGASGDLAGLMQRARILAAKNNATYAVRYATVNGERIAYVDLNGNAGYDAGEPSVSFPTTISMAAGAPGGTPPNYVLVGDSAGVVYDNTSLVGFTPRGLPCLYNAGPPVVCTAPAAGYFVHYLNDARPLGVVGWGGVVVARGGRSKAVVWNGTTWY